MAAADPGVTAAGIAGFAAIVTSILVYMRGIRSDEQAQELSVLQTGIAFLREDNKEIRQMLKECEERDRVKGDRIAELEKLIRGA